MVVRRFIYRYLLLNSGYFLCLGHFLHRLPCLYFLQHSFFFQAAFAGRLESGHAVQHAGECLGAFIVTKIAKTKPMANTVKGVFDGRDKSPARFLAGFYLVSGRLPGNHHLPVSTVCPSVLSIWVYRVKQGAKRHLLLPPLQSPIVATAIEAALTVLQLFLCIAANWQNDAVLQSHCTTTNNGDRLF
jgi:hypothetical protein